MAAKELKEHSAASRNQIPPFPRCAQRRRESGEKILAKLRDSDRLQCKQRRGKGARGERALARKGGVFHQNAGQDRASGVFNQ